LTSYCYNAIITERHEDALRLIVRG